jgi:23S rRNA G2445 N2-methylase RlmL
MIEFCSADISELDLRHSLNKPVLPNLIITNPPWDRRLGDSGAASAWTSLNQFVDINTSDSGGNLWALSGNPSLQELVELPVKKKYSFSAAGVDLSLVGYYINPIESK